MQQVQLVPAGCQPWYKNSIIASHSTKTVVYFAYCSTLSIHRMAYEIYDLPHETLVAPRQTERVYLWDLITPFEENICCLAWHPKLVETWVVGTTDRELHFLRWPLNPSETNGKKFELVSTIKTASPVTWSQFCPCDPSWLAYQEGPDTVKLLNQAGHINLTANFDNEIVALQWNHSSPLRLLAGDTEGVIYMLSIDGKKLHKKKLDGISTTILAETQKTVVDIRVDPNSDAYCLFVYYYLVVVYDLSSMKVISTQKPPTKISAAEWIRSVPGGFVTAEANLLRLWTVSQSTPLESFKLPSSVHSLGALESPLSDALITAFDDGSVGLYDQKKGWIYLRKGGHTETIFGCHISKLSNLVATCGYDGTCKIWKLEATNDQFDFVLKDSFPALLAGHKTSDNKMSTKFGILYSVSWSPTSNKLLVGSSRGTLIVYDATEAKIVETAELHKGPIYKVKWSSEYLVSCSSDGYCFLMKEDLTIIKKLKHPCEVFGVDICPFSPTLLSTGCLDGKIMIWDSSIPKDTPSITLSGHTSKVFTTCWSPHDENLLASASDDCDVRVWNIKTQSTLALLRGHHKKARAIEWHPEISSMIITGSWDADLRVWNIQNATCVQVVTGHVADIYGICNVHFMPFLFITTSRDNTIRLWSTYDFVRERKVQVCNALTNAFYKGAIEALAQPLNDADLTGCKLDGPQSKMLIELLSSTTAKVQEKLCALLLFTSPLDGGEALWKYVKQQLQPTGFRIGMVHNGQSSVLAANQVVRFMEMKAQSLELTTLLQTLPSLKLPVQSTLISSTMPQMTAETKNGIQNLRLANNLHVILDDLRTYCDNLCLLGHWDRALALAPSVSLDYWKQLLKRYNATMKKLEQPTKEYVDEMIVPFLVAAGEYKQCCEDLLDANDETSAYLLACVSDASNDGQHATMFQKPEKAEAPQFTQPVWNQSGTLHAKEPKTLPPLQIANNATKEKEADTMTRRPRLLEVVAGKIAARKLISSNAGFGARLASCWYLVAGDRRSAVKVLTDAGLDVDARALEAIKSQGQ